MSEIDPSPPPVPNAPPPVKRGSLALGVGLAWAVFIGGYFVPFAFFASTGGMQSGAVFVVFLLLPWLAMGALAVMFASRNQPRTAAGIGIGVASIFAVGLLLVAACFGILSTSGGFH